MVCLDINGGNMKLEDIENKGVAEIISLCSRYGISPMELSIHLQVTWTRIYEIMSGKRRITVDTDLRLCHFFKKKPGYFVVLQLEWDLEIEMRKMQPILKKIKTVDGIAKSIK